MYIGFLSLLGGFIVVALGLATKDNTTFLNGITLMVIGTMYLEILERI